MANMRLLMFVVLFAICLTNFSWAINTSLNLQSKNISIPPPRVTTPEPSPNTTISPPTTTKSTTPSTTTLSPTPPTTSTTPTTTKPSSTTPPSTTPPHTSTTPLPTTTTTTTESPPHPIPPPSKGSWIVNGTNETCIVVQFAGQIIIDYTAGSKKSDKVILNIPTDASSEGSCDKKNQYITIQWSDNKTSNSLTEATNNVTLYFNQNNDGKYQVYQLIINLRLNLDEKNYTVVTLNHSRAEFVAPSHKSYKCAKLQNLTLTAEIVESTNFTLNITDAVFDVSAVQVQAFRTQNSSDFDEALDCEVKPGTPDVVPIAVGCALAALVVIVLVAYLIGRKRSQARGYLSMFTETKNEEDYIPMKNLSCFK